MFPERNGYLGKGVEGRLTFWRIYLFILFKLSTLYIHYQFKIKICFKTSEKKGCQEKYQPQIYWWYHSNGRKWRGTSRWGWKRRLKFIQWKPEWIFSLLYSFTTKLENYIWRNEFAQLTLKHDNSGSLGQMMKYCIELNKDYTFFSMCNMETWRIEDWVITRAEIYF